MNGRGSRGAGVRRALAILCCLAGGLAGCASDDAAGRSPSTAAAERSTDGAEPEQPTTTPEVELHFDDLLPGDEAIIIASTGTAAVEVDVSAVGGGTALGARGLDGQALLLPGFVTGEPRYAVVRIRGAGSRDVLSPGEAPFVFGGDFALDRTSTGTGADNGDNLVQRGLFGKSAQYKIQLDGGRPSCRVAGTRGDVTVTMKEQVEPGAWYRARCTRRGHRVTLSVAPIGADGQVGEAVTLTEQGRTGSVVMASGTPMSVGGKLGADGGVVRVSSDQFNGLVDEIVYDLLD